MKVKDLIEVLIKCDSNKEVVVLSENDYFDDKKEILDCYEVSNSYNSEENNKVYIIKED